MIGTRSCGAARWKRFGNSLGNAAPRPLSPSIGQWLVGVNGQRLTHAATRVEAERQICFWGWLPIWALRIAMRVLINELSAGGARTGIGHYTAQLVRCLRAQAPHDVIESFPGPWVQKRRALWQRLRAGLQPESKAAPNAVPTGQPAVSRRPGWRAWCVGRGSALTKKWLASVL